MKIKSFLPALTIAACFLIVGCARMAPVQPPIGIIFTQYKAPLALNFKNNKKEFSEFGESETIYMREPCLGTSYAFGSAALKDAMLENNLEEVDYVDYEYLNVLGFYQRTKLIPHGKKK